MRVTRLGRVVGAVALASACVLTVSGTSSAAQPAWNAHVMPLPATVHTGADAGYDVSITNDGSSNISSLYLDSSSVATYVGGRDAALCSGVGVPLHCDFGAVAGWGDVEIVVAFKTGSGSSFTVHFAATTTGISGDKHNHSHGDALDFSGTTTLSSDKNFAGGFSSDGANVQTDPSLSKKNVQSTSVTPPGTGVVATAQDGLNDVALFGHTFECPPGYCGSKQQFGEWSAVNVADGTNFGTKYFPVTIVVYGNSVPNGASLSSIRLIHTDDTGVVVDPTPLGPCTSVPKQNCIDVSKVGKNYKIVAWVDHNGGFKGML